MEKIKDAEYSATNIETLKKNVYAYATYANGLVMEIEGSNSPLYDKIEQAQNGIECLIDYINQIVEIAKKRSAG